jgi:hypothetical protein
MTCRYRLAVASLMVLATISLAGNAAAQTRHDIIRGIVTTDSGGAGGVVAGAEVVVTIAPARNSRMTRTDSSGRYSMLFTDGSGDYLVHVSAVGYNTFRKRVTGTGADSVFTVDVKLVRSSAEQLSAVAVTAEQPIPDRGTDMYGHGIGASDRIAGGVNAAVSPDQAGDLIALGATVPGVAITQDGLSVAGLGPGQNSQTLNGMVFGGTAIPRDAYTSVRVSSSIYDPSRGWFGGLNENVVMPRGGLFSGRHAHITVDAPALQLTDPVSAGLGQRFSNIIGSLGGVGSMDNDKYTYNYGVQAGRRSSDMISLSEAGPDILQRAGVSSDSVARLLDLLMTDGIPTKIRAVPKAHVSKNASFIARVDHAPYDWSNFKRASTTWGLMGYGNLSSDNAISLAPTSMSTRGASSSQVTGMLQALFSTYIHGDYLNEERSAITFSRRKSEPYLASPGGRVLIASSFHDGTDGLTSLDFGGDGSALTDTRQWTWETTSETQFYTRGREAHKVKLNADLRLDRTTMRQNINPAGTFFFQFAHRYGRRAAGQLQSFAGHGDTHRIGMERLHRCE